MQLLRPAGHPPGAEVQLLLRLQPDRVLSPVRGPGELWLAETGSRYSSLIGPGLPLRQAAEGLLPDQGGRVAAAVLVLGGRAARRRRHGPGLWAELGEDHGKLLVSRSGSLVIVRHYLAIRSIEYSSHVVLYLFAYFDVPSSKTVSVERQSMYITSLLNLILHWWLVMAV